MQDHSLSRLSSMRFKKTRLLKKLGICVFAFVFASFLMVYVWQRAQVVKVGYEIEALKKDKDRLTRENRDLQIESATLTSPERIEDIASRDIGMHMPSTGQVVLVKKVKRRVGAPPVASAGKAGPGKT